MINKRYQKLCIKEITGNITEGEKQALDSWLADSGSNKIEFEKLKQSWTDSGFTQLPASIDIDLEWARLNERLGDSVKPQIKESIFEKISSSRKPLFKLKPVLTGIFILFVIALGIIYLNRDVSRTQLNTVSTSNNEYKNLKLPDGTIVYLNSGSSISFLVKSTGDKRTFDSGERKVKLSGEAFFSVTRNKIPFIITTENAKVTVLGTKFDVLSRDENTRVVVKDGKVNFSPRDVKNKGIFLTKDQLSIISKNSEPTLPKEVDAGYFLGWMKGNLVFYRTPFKEIASDLERRYNVKISLQADSLNTYTLTGSFKNSSADSAVSIVCLALGFDFEKQNDIYIIKAKDVNQ